MFVCVCAEMMLVLLARPLDAGFRLRGLTLLLVLLTPAVPLGSALDWDELNFCNSQWNIGCETPGMFSGRPPPKSTLLACSFTRVMVWQ